MARRRSILSCTASGTIGMLVVTMDWSVRVADIIEGDDFSIQEPVAAQETSSATPLPCRRQTFACR